MSATELALIVVGSACGYVLLSLAFACLVGRFIFIGKGPKCLPPE